MHAARLSQDVINQAVMHLLAYREATDPERYRATVIAQWCGSHPDNQRAWQRVDDINARLQPLRGQPVTALAQSLDAPGVSRRDLLRGGGALVLVLLTPPAEYLPEGEEAKTFASMNAPPGYNLNAMVEIGKEVQAHFLPLVDADPASNAAGWQWTAGSGADASPYFRVFNPITQGQKFDQTGAYVRKWCPELNKLPNKYLHAPWEAGRDVLKKAGIELGKTYPRPIIEHKQGRQRALDAWETLKGKQD